MDRFYASASVVTLASSWGPVRVAASARGVVAVELLGTDDGFEAGLRRRGFAMAAGAAGAADVGARKLAVLAATAVDEALSGGSPDITALPLDIGDRPEWDQMVLAAVRAIPRGATASYGEIARRIGRPGAARAAGGAVGRNPVGILVPCHRVIAADGSLGGYGAAAWGGVQAALDLKQQLLALEGVVIER